MHREYLCDLLFPNDMIKQETDKADIIEICVIFYLRWSIACNIFTLSVMLMWVYAQVAFIYLMAH